MKRIAILLTALATVAVLAILGSRWVKTVDVQTIEVRGFARADSSALAELAGVQDGASMMDVSAEVVADRVRRHPWVENARVSRHPTGTLVISVTERKPVALVLDENGRPDYFFDRHGFRMPVVPGPGLDIPVFRGLREAYHPVTPAQDQPVTEFLALLPELPEEVDVLVSEVHRTRQGLELRTVPSPAGQSIRVRMGGTEFENKLDRLEAFWTQSVLSRPNTTFDWMDLRFEGQVVTSEQT